jgi:hypothetical protein
MSEVGLRQQLEIFCGRLLPRMLTQVCRDRNSAAYGSFDRNWWHYKIRDFSSIILQQGGYALYCASRAPTFGEHAEGLKSLAAASCRFWNRRAVRHGAFEEYYPWEQGYPPVAFSALAVAKMVAAGVAECADVALGLEVAARQLQDRFEPKATNQQVAGTAALCWIRKIVPGLVDESVLQRMISRTVACQQDEGWYMEYGGPDLGYLSVTMDCLWDAYDATGDLRFRDSAARALKFLAPFATMPQRGAGMHNARNTDYIVPYGIARFLADATLGGCARGILFRTFERIDHADHFLHAIDDRYYCHYLGHSMFRALSLIDDLREEPPARIDRYFSGTGHWLRSETPSACAAMVSARKGGIFSISFGDAECADFGWIVGVGGDQWVSHWWGDFWRIERRENYIRISGRLTRHRENLSSPFKHLVLRALSLVFGRRIISLMKEKLIFKERQAGGPSFSRSIEFQADRVEVIDAIELKDASLAVRAPRSSKRHVASADSHHREDLTTVDPRIVVEERRSQSGARTTIVTTYRRRR